MYNNSIPRSVLHCTTLVDLLRYRSFHQPNQVAYTFLVDGETEEVTLTYQELDQKAQAIAVVLQNMKAMGERALLLYPPGLEFIAAFFGCLYAGVVAVPAYPPRRNQRMTRLQGIAWDAQAKFILSTTSVLTTIKQSFSEDPELTALHCIATDNIASNEALDWQVPRLDETILAFLQYTSGSTGMPKGVMVSHGNLLHNEEMIKRAFQHTEESIVVGWLPLFHDMGLIGNVLQPVYLGIPSFLMSPVAFLQKPFRWLNAISRYKATTSGGPNFAYDLCVRQITPEQQASLDLSSWGVAFNGAEPVRAQTLERFARTFAPCGFRQEAFYPCYGMAETTLLVSGGLKTATPVIYSVDGVALERNSVVVTTEEKEDTRKIVGCGQSWLDQKIVIVDPETLTLCPPAKVGEIWVSGPSIAQGYWHRPEETEQVFNAYLADTKEGPFLRTGDLGFLQDGELFVTGRLKDLIIILGRNHYPQDIELTVEQSHPALRRDCGAAFAVEVDGCEKLVIVQEVERSYLRKLNTNEVIEAIRRAVAEQHDLQVYTILLLKTASLPKTSSGKVQRSACRAGFLAASLDVVADWSVNPRSKAGFRHLDADVNSLLQQMQMDKPQKNFSGNNNSKQPLKSKQKFDNQEAIEAWLITKVAKQLEIAFEDIDIQQPLANYGLSSLAAVSISGELQEWLGRKISPTLLYDYPTIKALAQHLALEPAISPTDLKVDNGRRVETEPIAIVGIGCRFPNAKNSEAFWQLLHQGIDAIQEVPLSRWDASTFYDSTPAHPGKMNTRWGGFLEQVNQFDPEFFGISPREAESMDPQQRLLLEVTWEALENASVQPEQLAGSHTGVFIGISSYDYSQLLFKHAANLNAYSGTGNAFSIAANRLSYLLDLRGPSWAVDTACSSSLVAVHHACLSLHQGECQMAIAGGVNVILTPQLTITFSQAKMMAGDGRCKTFDAKADGYVRGEGCGVVILKRLSDAKRDGDNILALIRGSAVNQDGRSNGLTAPNGLSQQAVIRQALANAGVAPAQISYVEAHGTGTSLGDPIEVNSLKEVLMVGRKPEQPCWIGSVKTNIGHLEAAAGIASLIKVVLSLQHEEIPPHLHLNELNPHIVLEGTPLSIPTKRQKWSGEKQQRLAGVSSFGFGGTNAHVILEEAAKTVPMALEVERSQHLLSLSAKSDKALRELAQRYEVFLASNSRVSLADICFTANTGRSHFDYRLAVVTESNIQLQKALSAFAAGKQTAELISSQVKTKKRPKIAFLFTGQGSQYVDMGRQLYETAPVFRQTLDYCDEILRPYLQESLLKVLYPEEGETSPLNQTAYTQPALFALEYALVQLWKSWGVEPTAVMGHSLGEYVAACVAGVFSLEDGLKFIATRARLMQSLAPDGEMVAVFASEATIRAITTITDKVAFAAFNGSENTVISGEKQAVKEICAALEAVGISTKKLQTSHAFHSPLMDSILTEFRQVAASITYATPQIDIISNITGEPLTIEAINPDYWCCHLRSPVQFAASLQTLHASDYEVFVEIGPKPTLLGMGRNCLPEGVGTWLPSLRLQSDDWQTLLQSLGSLYVRGIPINWSGFDQDYSRQKVVLPTYPFQRQHYWIENCENKPQQTDILSSEKLQTTIDKLLHQGKIQELAQHLQKAGNFSSVEMQLLPKMLEVFRKQYAKEVESANIKNLFYQVEWQPKPQCCQTNLQETSAHMPGHWLIFADVNGLGKTLAELLQQRGQNCILVYPGNRYENTGVGTWSINPNHPGDLERLFQETLETSKLPLTGVIHLWSLTANTSQELTLPTLEQAQKLGCGNVLHLVQTLVKYNRLILPRLWLITRGGMPLGQPQLAVAQASLWGLGKVIAREHPEIWGGMLDLDPEATSKEAELLLAEIWGKEREDHLALRNEQCYVARLMPTRLPEAQGIKLKADATYLITGGLGALGLKVAQWMVEQGVRYLVLTGRNDASTTTQETLNRLEQMGTKILIAKADVSQIEDMVKVFAEIHSSMPPLQGVIHAAGVLDDGILLQQNCDRFSQVMAPKVMGAWNLHTLTQNLPLDFFVLFSSAASLLGSVGQGNYAAANTFMDVLAHYRQIQGMPGLSINWGPWAEVGMATRLGNSNLARLAAQGLEAISSEQALQVLEQLLSQSTAQIAVISVKWSDLMQQFSTQIEPPYFTEIHPKTSEVLPNGKAANYESRPKSKILPQLSKTPASKRLDLLVAYLQQYVNKVLGFSPSKILEPQECLLELGLDSLMAVQLKNWIATDLEVNLPVEKFINGSSILQLAKLLLEELTLVDTTQSTPIPSTASSNLDEIKLSTQIDSTSCGSLASAVTSSHDILIEGEI